jgi:hypothetical protein
VCSYKMTKMNMSMNHCTYSTSLNLTQSDY